MKAMILGAGKGTRVRPITNTVPKPMIPLVRKPVMESIVEHLAKHGVDQIVVNTSYLAPSIEHYFRDGDRYGVQMAYSFEGRLVDGELEGNAMGSAGGMKRVQDFSGFFDETFVVLCGDAVIDVDFTEVLRFHRQRNSVATIVLKDVPREEVSSYGVVRMDDDGRILELQEKPDPADALSTTVNTGIYMFEPSVFDLIPSGVEYDIDGQLFPALAEAGLPFYGVSLPFQWVGIGSVTDYWNATRLVLEGAVNGYHIPGREVRAGVHLGINVSVDLDAISIEGPVYIGSGTAIGAGARIVGPTMIGANCVIEAGAVVEECILDDYTRVSAVAQIAQKIVFGGQCIDPDGSAIDIAEADIGWLMDDARREAGLDEWQQALVDLAGSIPR
jgi:mannose-1-phosphate guanylyltransferase